MLGSGNLAVASSIRQAAVVCVRRSAPAQSLPLVCMTLPPSGSMSACTPLRSSQEFFVVAELSLCRWSSRLHVGLPCG